VLCCDKPQVEVGYYRTAPFKPVVVSEGSRHATSTVPQIRTRKRAHLNALICTDALVSLGFPGRSGGRQDAAERDEAPTYLLLFRGELVGPLLANIDDQPGA
jgi:hypothetical protein